MSDRTIASARITPLPRTLDPIAHVWVTYDGADSEELLLNYYPDEINFRADEFIGLTEQQARTLKFDKDRAYLTVRTQTVRRHMTAPDRDPDGWFECGWADYHSNDRDNGQFDHNMHYRGGWLAAASEGQQRFVGRSVLRARAATFDEAEAAGVDGSLRGLRGTEIVVLGFDNGDSWLAVPPPPTRVRLEIPADFFADVEVDHNGCRITGFVVSPLESHAQYFGDGAEAIFVGDAKPITGETENIARAAVEYWKAGNDDTWPLDNLTWEE